MVMLPSTRRRVDEFDDALAGRGPATDPDVAALVNLAEALREAPTGPAPDFRDQLRRRLVAVASLPAPEPTVTTPLERVRRGAADWRVRRRARLATGLVAAVTVVVGIGAGASTSVPGNPLYALKRGAEQVQLAAAGSDYAKGMRQLEFARTRLHEVAVLADRPDLALGRGLTTGPALVAAAGGTTDDIVDTLDTMDAETRSGAQYLAKAFQSDPQRPEPLQRLTAFSAEQSAALTSLLPALPAGARPRAETSLALLQRIDALAQQVLVADACSAAGCHPSAGNHPTGTSPGTPGAPGTQTGPDGSTLPSGQPTTAPTPATGASVVPGGTGTSGQLGAAPTTSGDTSGLGGLLSGAPPLPPVSLPPILPTTLPSLPLPTTVPKLPLPTTLPKLPTTLPSVSLPPILPTKTTTAAATTPPPAPTTTTSSPAGLLPTICATVGPIGTCLP